MAHTVNMYYFDIEIGFNTLQYPRRRLSHNNIVSCVFLWFSEYVSNIPLLTIGYVNIELVSVGVRKAINQKHKIIQIHAISSKMHTITKTLINRTVLGCWTEYIYIHLPCNR